MLTNTYSSSWRIHQIKFLVHHQRQWMKSNSNTNKGELTWIILIRYTAWIFILLCYFQIKKLKNVIPIFKWFVKIISNGEINLNEKRREGFERNSISNWFFEILQINFFNSFILAIFFSTLKSHLSKFSFWNEVKE